MGVEAFKQRLAGGEGISNTIMFGRGSRHLNAIMFGMGVEAFKQRLAGGQGI